MKHAVLIMAHKNKEQVIRLIRALACDEFDFLCYQSFVFTFNI